MLFLQNSADKLKKVKKFYLSLDSDKPGIGLRKELSRRLGKAKCYLVDLGKYKDANEALINEGSVYLKNAIDNAKKLPIEGITTIEDMRQEMYDLHEKGFEQGEKLGYPELDKHLQWFTSQLTFVTGIPSHGKSRTVKNRSPTLI